MLRRVDLVRTNVSEERSASIIRVTRIGKLGTKLSVTDNRRTLRTSTCIISGRTNVCPNDYARQWQWRIVGRAIFCAGRVIREKNVWFVSLSLLLLDNK
jgi:hypothetical protein